MRFYLLLLLKALVNQLISGFGYHIQRVIHQLLGIVAGGERVIIS
jgi:hypothetical protein